MCRQEPQEIHMLLGNNGRKQNTYLPISTEKMLLLSKTAA
jgi:hypothetical protein